jgi:excinuclease UvrABC nuclease subunit
VQAIANASGLIEFIPENVEKVPDEPGVYLIIASGQKILYVAATAGKGLRESLWNVIEEQPFGATEYFRYIVEKDEEKAAEIVTTLINEHKPPHNIGYRRFRNEEVRVPRQGHSIRHAAPNPSETK